MIFYISNQTKLLFKTSGDLNTKMKKGKMLMNNINSISGNHQDNRLEHELMNHKGLPLQVK